MGVTRRQVLLQMTWITCGKHRALGRRVQSGLHEERLISSSSSSELQIPDQKQDVNVKTNNESWFGEVILLMFHFLKISCSQDSGRRAGRGRGVDVQERGF